MSWFITNFIATFLMPPLSFLIVLVLGIILLYRRHKLAKPLIVAASALLWITSTPYFAEGGLHLLEAQTTALNTSRQSADAIVILGGGTYFKAPEYNQQDTIGGATLLRLRYGAKLHRETGMPILVTGGKPVGNQLSEAQHMRSTLEQEFQVPVRWTEDTSDNTLENAQNSFSIFQKEGIKKVYLVTHAWHMPRSASVFRKAGLEVVEAPTSFTTRYRVDALAFLPNAASLHSSKLFFHEAVGSIWYRIKSAFSNH
ncbi:MAG: YdcF family protein [Gallionella sp.]